MRPEDRVIIHALASASMRDPVEPDMVPQVSEEDRARFLAFLEANAAEVATWPAWKQRAFRMVKDGER